MKQTRLPKGWDESKVRAVLTYYENQSEQDATSEDEAGVRSSDTVMSVPHELVPRVREMIAKHSTRKR